MVALPREVLVVVAVLACQLLYSQVYPTISPFFREAWRSLAEEGRAGAQPEAPAPREEAAAGPAPGTREAPASSAAGEQPGQTDEYGPGWPWRPQDKPKRRSRFGKVPKYKVGDVVRDKVFMFRGVVAGWDFPCDGPPWWQAKRLVHPAWREEPCYGVLVDWRDVNDFAADDISSRTEEGETPTQAILNLTQYAPEATLEVLTREGTIVVNPMVPRSFRFFDEGRYVPEHELIRNYPDDVPSHYVALDAVQANQWGRPLLRVMDFGRLIAHGPPVPVIRQGMFLVATGGVQGDLFGQSAVLVLDHSDGNGTLGVIVNKQPTTKAEYEKAGRAMIDKAEDVLGRAQSQWVDADSKAQLEALSAEIRAGRLLLKLAGLPGVDFRVGGPVGLDQYPLGPSHTVLHPFKEPEVLREASTLALAGSGTSDDPDLFYVKVGYLTAVVLESLMAQTRKLGKEGPRPQVLVFAGNSGWGPNQLAGEIRGGLGGGSSWGWVPASPREVLQAGAGSMWKELHDSKATQFLELS